MAYEARVDRNNPVCMIFLVDQSASMAAPLTGTPVPKSAVVAEQLNLTIMELIQRATKSPTELPRPYFAIAVLGYTSHGGRASVRSLINIPDHRLDLAWTTHLAQHPARVETRERHTPQGPVSARMPVWVDPESNGGTPMCAALDRAGRIARSWVHMYPNGFPPIVINLTDGESTDGDPTVWANHLQRLSTHDGGLLLFNVMMSSSRKAIPALFPADELELKGSYAKTLFRASSVLPEFMRQAAAANGYPTRPGARGLSMNADFRSVVSFLNVGTSVAHLLR